MKFNDITNLILKTTYCVFSNRTEKSIDDE
jgi:hypothetical protein